jgi:hypothetical protein
MSHTAQVEQLYDSIAKREKCDLIKSIVVNEEYCNESDPCDHPVKITFTDGTVLETEYMDSVTIHWLCKLNEYNLKNPAHFSSTYDDDFSLFD